jgi:hypothetical protein
MSTPRRRNAPRLVLYVQWRFARIGWLVVNIDVHPMLGHLT